jgi:hypothetical protein
MVQIGEGNSVWARLRKSLSGSGGALEIMDSGSAPAVKAGWNGKGGEICAATEKRGTQCIDISVPLQMR